MSISDPGDPRANQKARTRAALVEAATELLRSGAPPTVSEAAEHAQVSRATAYRYFPTQESLLLEVADVSPMVQPVEALLDGLETDDVEARLVALLDTFNPIVVSEQAHLRTALRVYLDTWLERRGTEADEPVREGRRMRWLDEVLAPVRDRLTDQQLRRLRAALALTTGIEAVVVLQDVCHVDDEDELVADLRWAATAMLRAALAEASPRAR